MASFKLPGFTNAHTRAVVKSQGQLLDGCTVRLRVAADNAVLMYQDRDKRKRLVRGSTAVPGASMYDTASLFKVARNTDGSYTFAPMADTGKAVWVAGDKGDIIGEAADKKWKPVNKNWVLEAIWSWNEPPAGADESIAVKLSVQYDSKLKKYMFMNTSLSYLVADAGSVTELKVDIHTGTPALQSAATATATDTPGAPGTPGTPTTTTGTPGTPGTSDLGTQGGTQAGTGTTMIAGLPWWAWLIIGIAGFLLLLILVVVALR
jgi:hypothetical protein